MGARNKLNVAALYMSVAVAGLSGWVLKSWIIFWLVLATMIISSLHSGTIRPKSRQP